MLSFMSSLYLQLEKDLYTSLLVMELNLLDLDGSAVSSLAEEDHALGVVEVDGLMGLGGQMW
jgi:hypothetical protein